jgi:hypothetical protein
MKSCDKCTYVPADHTHKTLPFIFSFCSFKLEALTVISIPFHKLFEMKAIFLQLLLHVIQRSFVRVRSSERDVNHCCKKKDFFYKSDWWELQLTLLRPQK